MATSKSAAPFAAAMVTFVGRMVTALTVTALLTLGLGTIGASAAAPPTIEPAKVAVVQAQSGLPTAHPVITQIAPASVAAPHVARATPWSKTWAFTQCIFGSGVPIGIALAIATTPAILAWFAGRAVNAPLGYGWAISYWKWLKGRCAYALF